MARYAVVLLNLGGPDSPEAIEPFLRNLLSDADIFKIPVGQKLFARLIAKWRSPGVKDKYGKIGGRSPLNEWTALQAKKLKEALQQQLRGIEVYIGMRYWRPAIADAARRLSEDNVDKIVLLPLYPQYSTTTTGSSFREWQRAYSGPPSRLIYVDHYCDQPTYIAAVNMRIDEAVLRFPQRVRPEIQIVFSAHGTPAKLVKKGDPYSRQIRKTVEKVMAERGFSHPHHLCFQSRVGPLKWLEPSAVDTLAKLAGNHKKQILMVPISFVSDHIETLFELEIEYREFALKAGVENYEVMKGLNDSDMFISALKEIAMEALHPQAGTTG